MDAEELEQRLDDIFDHALLFSGYLDHMRDYEVVVHRSASALAGLPSDTLRYLFKFCVQAHVSSALPGEVWRRSLDERLVDLDGVGDAWDGSGYLWGVKWACLYPGATVVQDSPIADRWTDAVGIEFHEVRIETNVQNLSIVFSELEVSEVDAEYRPHGAGPAGSNPGTSEP
ncbi:hypothetical protein KSP35_07530 [Aquihabitans sp. G128]|uniref:YxiG-like protein n=1 Tax=Aquihabitans sp. G128 TaxID=2849779 RepID=UPI001C228893|nr:hypothetical protein [Aquihabitans sp. G128]QXC62635.1 hypothetical protein KSP35_07530 [Aquihabitans sp. G128]